MKTLIFCVISTCLLYITVETYTHLIINFFGLDFLRDFLGFEDIAIMHLMNGICAAAFFLTSFYLIKTEKKNFNISIKTVSFCFLLWLFLYNIYIIPKNGVVAGFAYSLTITQYSLLSIIPLSIVSHYILLHSIFNRSNKRTALDK